jgi:hypothetical protein
MDWPMDEWTIKTPNPISRLFFKIDLLTEFAALCLTDFIDWRYIHSFVGIFDPACELLPPWTKEGAMLVYCCPSIFSLISLPLSQTKCTVYTDSVCLGGGGGELCFRPYSAGILHPVFLTRFRTYQIASPPQTKWPVKRTLKVLSSHLNWGARLDSFDPLLNSRWPASLKFFFKWYNLTREA